MRKFLYILLLLPLLLLLTGCTEVTVTDTETAPAETSVTEPPAYPVTAGKLTFNSSPVSVGSLSPAVTEMMFELGYGDRLVCRSSYCNYPPEAESIPAAGSAANPEIDEIIKYSPALLITQSPIAAKDMSRLGEAGVAVLSIPAPRSAEELFENYRTLALIFAGSNEGDALAEAATAGLRAALGKAKGSCESLVFIMNITDDGFSAATGDTFAGDYAAHFGRNAAADNTALTLTADELIDADPQVILLAHPLESEDIDEDIASRLSAFGEGHVFVIDGSLTERPTARLADITEKISDAIRESTGGAGFTGGFAEIPETETAEPEQEPEFSSADVADYDDGGYDDEEE